MFKKNNKIFMQYLLFINKKIISNKKILILSTMKIILGSLATLIIPILNKIIIDNYINNTFAIIENIILLITIEFFIHIIIDVLSYKEKKYILNERKIELSQIIEKYVNADNDTINDEYINKFNRSKNFIMEYGITNAYNKYINVFQNIITIIGLIFLLDFFSLIIICFVLMVAILNVLIKNKLNIGIYYEKSTLTPITRKLFYMFGIMWDNQFAKEIRQYKAESWFKTETEEIIEKGEKVNKNIFKKNCKLDYIDNIIYIFELGLIYVFITIITINNIINVNKFTLYISTITSFTLCLKAILWSITGLLNNSLYFKDYSSFMKMSKQSSKKYIVNEIMSIEFKNVSFRYSNSKENIINNLSLFISRGESLTIVGKNGIGKSTIIKLLLRFLKPTSGYILINHKNLNDIDLNSYYEKLSCLFQNDILLPYALKDNISAFDFNKNRATHVAEKVLFMDVMKKRNMNFFDSYSTKLDENGVNFSGGEIQQLLLTRVLYKNSELLVLDEPSSNLSQLVENEFYHSLLEKKKNNIIIMVSHRLGFCDYSDKILVLGENKSYELGSQIELLNLRGLYYLMYRKYYNIKKN